VPSAKSSSGCSARHSPERAAAAFVVVALAVLCGVPSLQAQGNNRQAVNAPAPATYQARLLNLPPGGQPVVVYPAFQLLAIHNIDDEAETLEFSGVLTLVWRDPRQAFDPAVAGVEEKFYHGEYQFNELSPCWYPQVVLGNSAGVNDLQGVLLRVKPDGTSILTQTIHAVTRSRMNLRRYPFDHQRMEAVFWVLGFDDTEVMLASDAQTALAELSKTQVPQWDLTRLLASTRSAVLMDPGNGRQASVFVLTFELSRRSFFMVRLVILPLVLIVILSWSVFWMDRSSLGDRMSVSFVGILTAVAYQAMVSDIMPQIAYLTFMNAFLSFSFLVMCATAVVNLAVGECDRHGDPQRGDRVDRGCRWMFPLAYVGLILLDMVCMHFWS